MPIEKETEEIQTTRTETTTHYICDVEGCDESTTWDPRGDMDVATGSPGHSLNYVSLNPFVPRAQGFSGDWESGGVDVKDERGVFVCDDHLSRVGDLLL